MRRCPGNDAQKPPLCDGDTFRNNQLTVQLAKDNPPSGSSEKWLGCFNRPTSKQMWVSGSPSAVCVCCSFSFDLRIPRRYCSSPQVYFFAAGSSVTTSRCMTVGGISSRQSAACVCLLWLLTASSSCQKANTRTHTAAHTHRIA